ncbi:hypothetical protein ABZ951_24340 [Streptomyces sp. NPDC046215]|uniref:hypothetical protein n=1 Tax=Streptomyces TaxID=1883 RepID=UPI0031DF1336
MTGGRKIEVLLLNAFPSLPEGVQVGMQVLAVGARWKVFAPQKRNVDGVQLWISEHWHLAYWTWDKDTEQAGAPVSPPPLTPAERRAADRQRAAARHTSTAPTRGSDAPGAASPARSTSPGKVAAVPSLC